MAPVVLNLSYAIAVLVLASAGLVIVFGLMKVVNFAHGEAMMLGAYTLLAVAPRTTFWIGVLAAAVAVGLGGMVVERVLIRRLYRRPLDTILATWGLALLIREVVRRFSSQGYQSIQPPLPRPVAIFGTTYSGYRLLLIACAALVVIAFWVVERRTSLGRLIRGVIANPDLARGVGVNVDRVYLASFGVGTALAGVAGALLAPSVTIAPDMGAQFLIGAFLAAILAGGASLVTLAPAAVILGGSQGLVSEYVDQTIGLVVLLVVAMVVMRLRDAGVWRRA